MQKAFVLVFWLMPVLAFAQVSLFEGSGARQPLITVSAAPSIAEVVRGGTGSLFIGQQGRSLLAPYPKREAVAVPKAPEIARGISRGTPQLVALRRLIADAEAGPLDYDAVQYGARIKPSKPPTQMTLREIYHWIEQTPGQPHAIGRYQFIPSTLRSVVNQVGIPLDSYFSPEVQDRLSDVLLADAGLAAFTSGQMPRRQFMNNLAKIWAGFPNSTGRSHYHGYAGNKASISWARFEREMIQIFGT